VNHSYIPHSHPVKSPPADFSQPRPHDSGPMRVAENWRALQERSGMDPLVVEDSLARLFPCPKATGELESRH